MRAQVKDSINYVIGELTAVDGLCLVSFNTAAKLDQPLVMMDAAGKSAATSAVGRLTANGGTTIRAGLELAAAQLRARGPLGTAGRAATCVLLSDGQDAAAKGAPPVGCALYSLG